MSMGDYLGRVRVTSSLGLVCEGCLGFVGMFFSHGACLGLTVGR